MLKLAVMLCLLVVTKQEVTMVQGSMRGEVRDQMISYRGIPYGMIEDNGRFKQAGIAPLWTGIRESHQSRCSSYSKIEECLQLDVHVPRSGEPPWPVFVWVKGGSGSYDPGKFVQEGVIAVVVNHRLGPAGFLCLNVENIPGNAGVKDVVVALRWVRDNISAFRGNPHHVVVAGQGFGGAMVEALLLSPMAQGLFHGAIQQSGSILCPWSFNFDAKDRGSFLSGVSKGNTDELLSADLEDLALKSNEIEYPYYPFGMCVEKEFKHQERLLANHPKLLLTEKSIRRVPLITGYNSNEAYVFLSNIKENNILRKLSKDLSVLLPEELKFYNELELRTVMRQIKDMYFKNNATIDAVLAYHRDAYFTSHIYRSAKLHAASSPVYFYQFSHTSDLGVSSVPGVKKSGAAHSDELALLFPDVSKHLGGDDGIVQKNLLNLWINFVKYLEPTRVNDPVSRWEPVDPPDPHLLDITSELAMKRFPHKDAAQMWDDIYERYYYERNHI